MGIEDEADRTLFIRNLDTRVTEELLFELFLQAGPLVKTKIPKDLDGKQKTFGFAVYKHEVSVPYAMQLLNGTSLYGKTIQVQFRTGSSHSSPGNSQNSSPANTPNPHGQSLRGQRSLIAFFIFFLCTETIKVLFFSVRIEQPQDLITHFSLFVDALT
ncbi:hypothetical protein AMECASPLE_015695 [Ameca splendens]|uniref:RRM domain-containing protein n=1 Tax=Ameca splendens TaxID=208324 RepID=A0ABV0ZM85_9TELE